MLAQRVRMFSTSLSRASHGPSGGVPGENLPFDISNKYKLTALFIVYVGSAAAIPFLNLRHHLTKK